MVGLLVNQGGRLFLLFLLALILTTYDKKLLVQADQVCHPGGSTCPEDTCCNDNTCTSEAAGFKCCDESLIGFDSDCSPCPKCGKKT